MTLPSGLAQALTEMSTKFCVCGGREGGGSKARPARKADKLTAICDPIVM
jgi:hypothetical protein